MRKFWRTASRPAHLPAIAQAEEMLHSFTASGRALFYFFAGLLVVSSLGLLHLLNQSLLVSVPARGGTLTEGIIGSPRFINPVLAATEADRDLAALVYSGLLAATPAGQYVPDLAARYEISEDGSVYTFSLREDAMFHNGTAVRASDVVFTVAKIQDPATKSPLRASWEGVVAEEIDPLTVRFVLRAPYAPFIKNLTLGILPAHLWQSVSSDEFSWSDLNTSPVGSGPFRVAAVSRTAAGIPSSYELRSFGAHALGRPHLDGLILRFYSSEQALAEALRRGEISSAGGLSPALLADLPVNFAVRRAPQNRVFGVFFNQNQSEVLRDRDVREALSAAIDRPALVATVLAGFGTPLEEPIPPRLLQPLAAGESTSFVDEDEVGSAERVDRAREMLLTSGWKESGGGVLEKVTGSGDNKKTIPLAFSLSTGNVPELRAAAEALREVWSRMGAAVEVKIFEPGDLSQNVIRPRRYDALLFGQVVGRELDLFAFWHSSQRNDPGLNVALYANTTVDKTLEELRATADPARRLALYEQFRAEFLKDLPALLLYTPDFVYGFPENIAGLELGLIETPSDRFLSVLDWHTQREWVWPFFVALNAP